MNIEDKYRILALKKAAIVLNGLADSFKNEDAKAETKTLAWACSWAVIEIETLNGMAEGWKRMAENKPI